MMYFSAFVREGCRFGALALNTTEGEGDHMESKELVARLAELASDLAGFSCKELTPSQVELVDR